MRTNPFRRTPPSATLTGQTVEDITTILIERHLHPWRPVPAPPSPYSLTDWTEAWETARATYPSMARPPECKSGRTDIWVYRPLERKLRGQTFVYTGQFPIQFPLVIRTEGQSSLILLDAHPIVLSLPGFNGRR
jgi:hypothetical protein